MISLIRHISPQHLLLRGFMSVQLIDLFKQQAVIGIKATSIYWGLFAQKWVMFSRVNIYTRPSEALFLHIGNFILPDTSIFDPPHSREFYGKPGHLLSQHVWWDRVVHPASVALEFSLISLVPQGGPVCMKCPLSLSAFLRSRHSVGLRYTRWTCIFLGHFSKSGSKGVPPVHL